MKEIKNIGIDIDGTVLSFEENFYINIQKKYGKTIFMHEWNKVCNAYKQYLIDDTKGCFNLIPYPAAQNIIKQLNKNYNIIFITKRGVENGNELKNIIRNITYKSLRKYFGQMEYKVHFSADKWMYAKNEKIDIMIEDDLSNANKISKYCPVLIFPRPWNMGKKIKNNIIPVSDWKEVEFVIKNWKNWNENTK